MGDMDAEMIPPEIFMEDGANVNEVKEAVEALPLVSKLVEIDILKAEYAGNDGFLRKLDSLSKRFSSIRRIRPDGNCFYRAYLFGILEQIAGNKERHAAFTATAKQTLQYCLDVGYEKVAVEDFADVFNMCVGDLSGEHATAATAEATVIENDGYLVCWTRCLTSAHLKRHADDFSAFLTSHGSIENFCAQEVDPMATEADHLQIVALSAVFKVPVCVVYLDRSDGDSAAEHTFQQEDSSGTPCPYAPVFLLYRPGHYDIIYPR